MDHDCIAPTVAKAWQEVLFTPVGGPDEDFFEAGGDSLKALTLTMELERSLGVELSVTLINEAPKFASLCEALREQRTTRYVPLVLLKEGAGLPPVYFIHGVGGNVAELFPIARSMTYPGAVFGVQARGLARQQLPHTTVEAMATDYLREIKARQPDGPYYLCGYSFGGLVAFEMARRLRESGSEDRPGRSLRHDAEPSELATICLVRLCPAANGSACRQGDRRSDADLASGSLENGWPSVHKGASTRHANRAEQHSPSQLLEVRAQQRSQGRGKRADGSSEVPAWILSRGADAVHAEGA